MMTDLREHIATLKAICATHVPSSDGHFGANDYLVARTIIETIEAALSPKPGLRTDINNIVAAINESAAEDAKLDPKKQFVVGERYHHLGGTPRQCLFVFSDGSMAYEDRGQPRGSSFAPFGEWQFVASGPELDAAIAERDAAKASLEAAQARVAELGGE